jgi:hypothetical protein
MRTVRRLRLRCFTFYEYLSRAVHSATLCPVETGRAHHKQFMSDNPDISKGHSRLSLWHPRKGQI